MKYAVIQRGIEGEVFGVGNTRDEAIAEAATWLCDENGVQGVSVDDVEEMLSDEQVVGVIALINSDDEEWLDYVLD